MKIYVVLSESQDECTCSQRWWKTYAEASKYAKLVAEQTGCDFFVISLDQGTDKDMK